MFAVIEIRQWYGDKADDALLRSTHKTARKAKIAAEELNSNIYHLQHNQSAGYYQATEVIDDNLDYQSWIDMQDWEDCPYEGGADEYDACCAWAEEQARNRGEYLALEDGKSNYMSVSVLDA